MAEPKIAVVDVFVTCPARTNYVVVRVETDGYLEVDSAPGLGVEFDAHAAARDPHRQRWEPLVLRLDGSRVEP
jgi:hypothetical protein